MHKVSMTVDALLLIARSRVDHSAVSKHCASLVGYVKNVPVAFLALLILKRGISSLSVLFVIVFILEKVNQDILGAMECLGVEKIEGVVWGRKMTVHTVGYESLRIVYMGRGFPCVVGKMNLMTGGAESGRRSANHSVVREAEERKGQEDTESNENSGLEESFR
jgi:hypothetical protein